MALYRKQEGHSGSSNVFLTSLLRLPPPWRCYNRCTCHYVHEKNTRRSTALQPGFRGNAPQVEASQTKQPGRQGWARNRPANKRPQRSQGHRGECGDSKGRSSFCAKYLVHVCGLHITVTPCTPKPVPQNHPMISRDGSNKSTRHHFKHQQELKLLQSTAPPLPS